MKLVIFQITLLNISAENSSPLPDTHFLSIYKKTRIDYSCRLLQHTNMKVTEIANAVGYSDLHHFELLFRKYINRTPTEHRNFFKKASISHLLQI